MIKYSILNKASVHIKFLHTNSTTHEFLFGAFAELVDNARDADASSLSIYTEIQPELRGGFTLNFLDDGNGMDPQELAGVVEFGKSAKVSTTEKDIIGQYGNGLKSGSMRIGKDFILFTKKRSICSVLLISTTFLQEEKLEEIVVPLPSFNEDRSPWVSDSEAEIEKHKMELDIIKKYSPFKTKEQLFEQFDKITGESGTLVIIYNLKLIDTGETEIDINTDAEDIQMTDFQVNFDRKSQLEHKSLRHYLSILYSNPKMKVYIQNKKVKTKLLDRSLYMPIHYSLKSNGFKTRAKQLKERVEMELRQAKNRYLTRESDLANFLHKFKNNSSEEAVKDEKRLRKLKEIAKLEVNEKERELKEKEAFLKEPKRFDMVFGINIHNRNADGIFIYHRNRLITMFEHANQQSRNNEYRGIVAIVNIPYMVMEPTHNKQQFQEKNEQKQLIKIVSDNMEPYLVEIAHTLDLEFWSKYGYSKYYNELPMDEALFIKRRWKDTKMFVQCNNCLKWRCVVYDKNAILDPSYPPDDWTCDQNNDPDIADCDHPQVLEKFKHCEIKAKPKETKEDELPKKTKSLLGSNNLIRSNGLSSSAASSNSSNIIENLQFFTKKRKPESENTWNHQPSKKPIEKDPEYRNKKIEALVNKQKRLTVSDDNSLDGHTNIRSSDEPTTSRDSDMTSNESEPSGAPNDLDSTIDKKTLIKTLSSKYRLASSFEETADEKERIESLKHDELLEYQSEDLVSKYEKISNEQDIQIEERRLMAERDRVKDVLRNNVDHESYAQLEQLIFPPDI